MTTLRKMLRDYLATVSCMALAFALAVACIEFAWSRVP